MYRAKYKKHKKINSKPVVLLSSVALILLFSISGAVAYLFMSTDDVQNAFTPARVSCAVVENDKNFDGTEKRNIPIQNTGNVNAYIRASVVINWTKDGKIVPRPAGYGYHVEYNDDPQNDNAWFKSGDYWYFKQKVSPDGTTAPLIVKAYPTKGGVEKLTPTANDTYHLRIDIIADAVQAEPSSTVSEVWPSVTVRSSNLYLIPASQGGQS